MMTHKELWENRETILSNTHKFLKRVRNKKTKFTEQTRKRLNESGDTKDSLKSIGINPDEIKKIQWVLVNKFIPMLRTIGELQKDMEFLDSAKFGQWNIPKEELKEDKELLFKDKKVKVKTWKEGTSNPTSRTVGSPLEFTSYTIDGELSSQGRDNFIEWCGKRHHPNDFVWGNWNRRKEETSVFVMKNPSLKGLEVNGKKPPQKSSKKRITEKETPLTRVDKFKPEWDDVKKETRYPPGRLGQYRGIHSHTDQYIWNQLGTEKGKEELLDRMEKKLGNKGGGVWSDNFRVVELEKEGQTIVLNTWSFDSSD
jgi:hypothetical protein